MTTSLEKPKGVVQEAFGNLLQVAFDKPIRQGEVAYVHLGDLQLKAEVIEINGDRAKLQVYEDTRGVQKGTEVTFSGDLLEAELGPGLLSTVFDGLQSPLDVLAERAGFFLPKGMYVPAIDRERRWDFIPEASIGAEVKRGDTLGHVMENRFQHKIMVPFSLYGTYKVVSVKQSGSYNVDTVIATLEDKEGKQIPVTMIQKWPIKVPLQEGVRVKPTEMMETGLRTIDTEFPILKGGTFCTPGPFGAGKTVLQHHLSKYSSVDIVIVVACGERAGEVVEVLREFPHLVDPHTGDTLMTRTVIICNTSSMPVAARESSIYLGATLAEYYRQMGLGVLLLADSTSRWAQALREMSGRLEEIPGEEAFPAYLASRIAEFYERSGVIALNNGKQGSLTIGGAVSPAGGNFEEPVTQATLAVVGAFLGLSRERSDARRYPAIDPLLSWSKYVDQVGQILSKKLDGWSQMVKRSEAILFEGDEIGRRMDVVGEEGTAIPDFVTYLKAELFDFAYLQQNAFDKEDANCPIDRQLLLFPVIDEINRATFHFTSHDEAREYFLDLQGRIKNWNFLSLKSEEAKHKMQEIQQLIRKGSHSK